LSLIVPSASAQVAGPETFAKEPKTPLELWDAADYLVRTGQPAQAVPYLRAFLRGRVDDALLLEIRDRYGAGSVLRLDEYPETRPLARPILDRMEAAAQRHAADPARIERFVNALTASQAEQDYAIERLRASGPYAVPAILRALDRQGRGAAARAQVAENLGRLDRSAVPPLLAALEAPDPGKAADVARALGRIGDPRAIPTLTYFAAAAGVPDVLRDAARDAVEQLTGRPFAARPRTPARVLADEARRYMVHAYAFPAGRVEVWSWRGNQPVATAMSSGEAESVLGIRAARRALALSPTDFDAQATFVGLALRHGVRRAGLPAFEANSLAGDPAATSIALAAGPGVLEEVLRRAIVDGETDLAAATALVLARVEDRDAIAAAKRPSALVAALSAPDRRIRFAAARALVEMQPQRPFPGSSRVVPTLAWFVADPAAPRAVVVDGAASRAGRFAAALRALGYEASVAPDGPEGFRQAADSADVEAVFIEPSALRGDWRAVDLITNLRADARTAALPVFLVQPDALEFDPSFAAGPIAPGREIEPNDDILHANPLLIPPLSPRVRVLGLLQNNDAEGDYYRIGPLTPGTWIAARLAIPEASSLQLGDIEMTLEREVRHGGKPELNGLVVARSDPIGRIDYVVPATPEPEPKPAAEAAPKPGGAAAPKDEEKKADDEAKADAAPKAAGEAGPEIGLATSKVDRGPAEYGGYYLRVKGRVRARDRGSMPRYVLGVLVIDPTRPAGPRPALVRQRLDELAGQFSRVAVIVPTSDPDLLRRQVGRVLQRLGVRPLSEAERAAYAQGAAGLLGWLGGRPGTPFDADIARAGPALTVALNVPAIGLPAAAALGDVPGVEAQRGLADAALDPSRPAPFRIATAGQLARSIQRFGPLLADDQERRLAEELNREADPALRAALSAVLGALRPKPVDVGGLLQSYRLEPAAAPAGSPAAAPAEKAPPAANPPPALEGDANP
jgi:hypothetical protein